MITLNIRRSRSGDLSSLWSLLGQLGYPTSQTRLEKRLRASKIKPEQIWVAVEDKKVVGFVSYHLIPLIHEDGFLARVTALVVDGSSRNQGIGKRLLQKAETETKKKGAVKIEITSSETRRSAQLFYQKAGYREYRKRLLKRFPTK